MRFALLSCAAVLAAGCADMEWRKDGVDAATLKRDLDECQNAARVLAKRQTLPPGYDAPRIVGVDAENRVIMSTPGRIDSDRFVVEHDLMHQCMSSRGYELTAVRKP